MRMMRTAILAAAVAAATLPALASGAGQDPSPVFVEVPNSALPPETKPVFTGEKTGADPSPHAGSGPQEEMDPGGIKLPPDVTPEERQELRELYDDKSLTEGEKRSAAEFWLRHRNDPMEPPKPEEVGSRSKKIFEGTMAELKDTRQTVASLLGLPAQAGGKPEPLRPGAVKDLVDRLKGMIQVTAPLKMRYMVAVEATPGNMIWMSDNGRFVFKGSMYDTYNGMRELRDINDVQRYAMRVDYRMLKLDPDSLSSTRLGDGRRSVVIYVDPASNLTSQVLAEIMKYPDRKDFTFWFVVMPSDAGKSQDLAMRFYCARQQGRADIGNLLVQGRLDKLPEPDSHCHMDNWEKTLTAAYYTGVDVLPFFVGYDGSISRGIPSQGIFNWLARQSIADTDSPQGIAGQAEAARAKAKISEALTLQQATLEQRDAALKNYKAPSSQSSAAPSDEEEEEEDVPTLDAEDGSIPDPDAAPVDSPESESAPGQIPDPAPVTAEEKKELTDGVNREYSERHKFVSGGHDMSGFDMRDSIDRYKRDAAPATSDPLTVNGNDQFTEGYAEGDQAGTQRALRGYKPLDSNFARKARGANRSLVQSIVELQTQIEKTRNEFRRRREKVKDNYDKSFQWLETQYGWAMRYDNEKRLKVQAGIRQKQAELNPRFRKQIDDLNKAENEKLRELNKEIAFLKSGLANYKE